MEILCPFQSVFRSSPINEKSASLGPNDDAGSYTTDYNAYSEVTTEKIPLSANSSTTISRQREKTVQALFYEKTPVLQHCAAGITDFNLEILQISRCTTDRQQKMTEIFLFPS